MFTHFFRFALLLLVFVMLFAACGEDDNPIVDDDHDDEPFHADADGFILKVDGNEIYHQFQGTQTGGITLKVGEELDVLAVLLDHHEEKFFPEAPEEDEEHDHNDHGEGEVFALALSEFDSSIIEVHLYESEGDDHSRDAKRGGGNCPTDDGPSGCASGHPGYGRRSSAYPRRWGAPRR